MPSAPVRSNPAPARTSATLAALPPVRQRLSSEDRRQQLIEKAVELFSQRGFSGTRTKDIAAACGVSEGILFRHFATKEDLYRAILDSNAFGAGRPDWIRRMKQLAAARDDRGLIRSIVEQTLSEFRDNAAFHRLMHYAWLEGHALAELAHQQLGKPTFDFLRRYIALRQREGAFRAGDPGTLVVALYAPALQFATAKYLYGIDVLQQDDHAAAGQFTELLLAGLRAPAGKK
jgi:TetR/AcrR family transcriptional regulator